MSKRLGVARADFKIVTDPKLKPCKGDEPTIHRKKTEPKITLESTARYADNEAMLERPNESHAVEMLESLALDNNLYKPDQLVTWAKNLMAQNYFIAASIIFTASFRQIIDNRLADAKDALTFGRERVCDIELTLNRFIEEKMNFPNIDRIASKYVNRNLKDMKAAMSLIKTAEGKIAVAEATAILSSLLLKSKDFKGARMVSTDAMDELDSAFGSGPAMKNKVYGDLLRIRGKANAELGRHRESKSDYDISVKVYETASSTKKRRN